MLITRILRYAVVVLLMPAASAVAQESKYTPIDIENGRNIYQGNCSFCHGPEGDGVPGVDFGGGRLRRGSTDEQLVRIILGGIPGTGMPPSNFSESQAGTVVAYVRSLAGSSPAGVTLGDAARGRAVFDGKGRCSTCHSVKGTGSRVGPNLTEIGTVRRAAELQRSIVDPAAEVKADNRTVQATTRDGTRITGRLLNQDSFTVQILDSTERLMTLDKSNLREYEVLKGSPMPSFRDTLDAAELADVVGYLVTLKGKP